jgi:hypothetical protein
VNSEGPYIGQLHRTLGNSLRYAHPPHIDGGIPLPRTSAQTQCGVTLGYRAMWGVRRASGVNGGRLWETACNHTGLLWAVAAVHEGGRRDCDTTGPYRGWAWPRWPRALVLASDRPVVFIHYPHSNPHPSQMGRVWVENNYPLKKWVGLVWGGYK